MKTFACILFSLPIAFLWLSCDSTNTQKEAEIAQKEQKLLERENELLKKENEQLKRDTAVKEQRKRKNRVIMDNLQPQDLVGTWNVTMSRLTSDCSGYPAGDVIAEDWVLDFVEDKIIVKVSNSGTNVLAYKGEFQNNTLTLKSTRTALLASGTATVKANIKDLNQMTGSREMLKGSGSSICKIDYSIVLNRATPHVEF